VIVGARGLRLPKGREDWYNAQEGKPHPGAEYPWGVARIYPESWIRPPRGSLFPLVPEARSTPSPPQFALIPPLDSSKLDVSSGLGGPFAWELNQKTRSN
jgi:hypothetical protein